ncbi:MAG: hypothetical protein OXG51_13225 [Gammaproteobacteria bacterium]|nr:hypothetical protein [Gammaproteobacteria bacterium]
MASIAADRKIYDSIDIQQYCRIVIYPTNLFYNKVRMKTSETPEFYTGAPVDPVDLRFRSAFLAELWQSLSTSHVVLTAPRRTGKTSVMDYLRQHPQNGYSVASINVQDLTHPADFFQALLDALHDAHPQFVRDQLAEGWALLNGILDKVSEVEVGGFKLALRGSDPNWRDNWRQHGDQFLAQASRFSSSSTNSPTCCSNWLGRTKRCWANSSAGSAPKG